MMSERAPMGADSGHVVYKNLQGGLEITYLSFMAAQSQAVTNTPSQ